MTLNSRAGWERKVGLAHQRSHVLVEIAPRVVDMPAPIQKYDDPFLPYCRAVFAATGDFAAGYVLDLAAFLALGAAGAVALERAAAILAVTPPMLSILHGPFARAEYAAFCGPTALHVDGATVTDLGVATAFTAQGITGILERRDCVWRLARLEQSGGDAGRTAISVGSPALAGPVQARRLRGTPARCGCN